MNRLVVSMICIGLNVVALSIFGYLKYLLSLDAGYSVGAGIWGALAFVFLLVSALVYYLNEHGIVVRVVWFSSATLALWLVFVS